MSEYATFADGAVFGDPTDQSRSFISYYDYGATLALALDLSLRERSDGRQSLDDVMRLLWRRYGVSDAPPGIVAHPYTLADVRDVIGEVAGDRAFANDFVEKYVEGRDVPDYTRLLSLAGFSLRRRFPDRAWTGAQVGPAVDGITIVAAPAAPRSCRSALPHTPQAWKRKTSSETLTARRRPWRHGMACAIANQATP